LDEGELSDRPMKLGQTIRMTHARYIRNSHPFCLDHVDVEFKTGSERRIRLGDTSRPSYICPIQQCNISREARFVVNLNLNTAGVINRRRAYRDERTDVRLSNVVDAVRSSERSHGINWDPADCDRLGVVGQYDIVWMFGCFGCLDVLDVWMFWMFGCGNIVGHGPLLSGPAFLMRAIVN
jgi:hypothetical protein